MNRLGKVLFLLSLLCFLTTFGLKIALSGWMPFYSFGFGFGLFFLICAIALNLNFFRSLFHSESLKFLFQSFVTLIIMATLLVCFNYVVFKKTNGIDITSDKIHSLSDLTQSLVKAIPEKVRFVYFHADNDRVKDFERQVQNEIKRYRSLNSKVQFESYSIFKRPDLAAEFKVGQEESSLYAKYKDRIERVTDLTEVEITNALLKLTKPPKKVYFVEGHGERKSQDESTFGLSGLSKELSRLHYHVDKIESLIAVPQDAAILVFAGPKKALVAEEIHQIELFLNKGGSVLIAIDPKENHGLHGFLKHYLIKTQDQFVFTAEAQAGKSPLLVPTYIGESKSEMSKGLEEGENPYLFISSVIEIIEAENKDFRVIPILEHLPNSIGRKDLLETSPVVSQGKQTAAVLAEGFNEPFFRLIVIGDSDFLTNQFYTQKGNFDFSMSLFTYLSKDEDLLKLKTRTPKTTYLLLTQTQLNIYFLFFILPFIGFFFILALFFKLRRFF